MPKHAVQSAAGLALFCSLIFAGISTADAIINIAPNVPTFLSVAGSPGSAAESTDPTGQSASEPGVWTLEPSGTTEILSDVWGSGHELFAVGSAGTILYFNGTTWQPFPSGSTADLQGVWGNSMTDVFAAGPDGTVLHYTGSQWTTMTTPTVEFLRGVWGTSHNDVYITGTRGTIIHYDGVRWTAMDSGSPNRLYDIWGSAADDIFVTGHLATILHYDGLAWSTMDSGTRPTLWGVWGANAGDVFVVGASGAIVRFDGAQWSLMTSGVTEDLYRVWGASATDIYAVGGNGTILHHDGAAWNVMQSNTTQTLKGIFGTSRDNIVAVGENGTILRYSGGNVPVFIRGFDARATPSAVDLSWETQSTKRLKGFKIQKTDDGSGRSMLPLDGGLIPWTSRDFCDPAVSHGRSYGYTLIAVPEDGPEVRSQTLRVDIPIPCFAVKQNHPNPFNPSTRIALALPHTTIVRAAVYDSRGHHVVTLIDKTLPTGSHVLEWDGLEAGGSPVAAGVYFCRITGGKQRAVIKMTLVK